MTARVLNMLIGVYLFVSVFLWRHDPAQAYNGWLVGICTFSIAWLAIAQPKIRFFNTALGIWLFLSAWLLPTTSLKTLWTDIACGVAITFLSLWRGVLPRGTDSGYFPRAPRRPIQEA